MNALLTLFFFLVIIGFLVFVHELGHFLAAKLIKVPVHQFAIGFGPTIFKRKYKETDYQIRILPLGGFVELEGEQDLASPVGFRKKGFLKKTFVLSAGVAMNFLVAIIFLMINLVNQNYIIALPDVADYKFNSVEEQIKAFPILVTKVIEGGPSDGQLVEGDIIIAIEDKKFENVTDYTDALQKYQGTEVEFTFLNIDEDNIYVSSRNIKLAKADKDGKILQVYYDYEKDLGKQTYFLEYKRSPISAVAQAFDISIYQIKALGNILTEAVEEGDYSEVSKTVGGPVALGGSINQAVELEVLTALFFLAGLISLSLAIFNILPIPALDGGQIAIAAVESVIRRPIPDKIVNRINMTGFVFLMSLGFLVMIKDLIQFNVIGGIVDVVKSALGR